MTKPIIEGFCNPEFAELEKIFSKAIQSGFDDGAGFSLEPAGTEVLNLLSTEYETLISPAAF